MVIIGLTGSIGMGKSSTADVFRKMGVRVHDSDAAVHAIYRGRGALQIEERFPGVVVDGSVDRGLLSKRVFGDSVALKRLESVIHPIVAEQRNRFISNALARRDNMVVLDIPLLFEIGGVGDVDVIVVVSAPASVQKSRVLARPGMTPARFEAIIARQTPDSLKRRSAHFVVDSGLGLEAAERQVRCLMKSLSFHQANPTRVMQ